MYYRKRPITKRDLWLFLNAHPVQTDDLESVKETLFLLLSCHPGEFSQVTFADVQVVDDDDSPPCAILTVYNHKRATLQHIVNLRRGSEEEVEDLVYVVKPDLTKFCPYQWFLHYLDLWLISSKTSEIGPDKTDTHLFSGIGQDIVCRTMRHFTISVHHSKISHRSFRHGYAVDQCFLCDQSVKLVSCSSKLSTVKASIVNGRNWTTNKATGYLYYYKGNIDTT
ncbi:hypothetical protein L596_007736 [Steinernema carpocapsae]|uniref:Uncharacterized protein n=1 Tax=Steinernema carpocapsae TaxID=34508 RepID=A0A4U5PAC2_STECR|nr:hypothetical protein L596_007736 [Steinernema carpocapsae]